MAVFFCLNFCDTDKAHLYTRSDVPETRTAGLFAYPMNDPEPYLLINPLYYQGLDLSSIDDPVLVEWLEFYEIESGEES
jgi:hypothetical protein